MSGTTPGGGRRNLKPVVVACAAVLLFASYWYLALEDRLSLEALRENHAQLHSLYGERPWLSIAVYFALYVVVAALSLPGAAVMTLAGGAIFGLLLGTVIVSFASSIGASLAFLLTRAFFRPAVQARLGERLERINRGFEREGAFYLFTLRLVPAFPFFAVNLAMGVTSIKASTFYWVSQLGMLPGTIAYVNAGTQLAQIRSLGEIISFDLLLAFAILGILPLSLKWLADLFRSRRKLRCYSRPAKFDYNLVVIGGGAAGLVTAYVSAASQAKVALIEQHRMGGDCLNTGCVPSKALIKAAQVLANARRAEDYGMRRAAVDLEFAEVMERVQHVISLVEPHDSVARYRSMGVECFGGRARITSPFTIEIEGRELSAKNIVVASGAEPRIPDLPGIDQVEYLTSESIWSLRELPARLLVLGGGPVGCELAQAFARFGAEVTVVEMGDRILSLEDPDVSALVREQFSAEGIEVLTGHKAVQFLKRGSADVLVCEVNGRTKEIDFDRILIALGRRARVSGFGLEELGIELTERNSIAVDEFMRTNIPNIYACGDVAGPFQFTHVAAHQAWYAAINALFTPLPGFRVDYRVVPRATFTDPEVARVGLNETEARQQGKAHEVTIFELSELDRAITDEVARGFIKVLTVPGRDRILGVTIVGARAGEIIAEYVLAMRNNLGLNRIIRTIHIYPTMAEANKYAAGAWKRNHLSPQLLRLLKIFNDWRRGQSN